MLPREKLLLFTVGVIAFHVCNGISHTSLSGVLPGGRRAPCNNEGESVPVHDIDKRGCFSCICKNGFVECRSEYVCPPIDGCHMLVEKTEDGCCQRCKGCNYKGVHYPSHTEWADPSNPCKVMRCEAGIVTESVMQCHTPCSNPLPPPPGKCCPTCSECKINGQIATDDRDVTSDDPCLKCRCIDGRLMCTKTACPVLQCSADRQQYTPGECCPKCTGTRSLFPVSKKCTVGSKLFLEGDKFNTDRCTHCSCTNETAICRRNSCPVLNCSPIYQEKSPGSCCPYCNMPEEFRSQCSYMGNVYEDGQSWKLDACSSCKCVQGMPSCAMTRCNVTLPCPPGSKFVQIPGECCGKCVENEGACMAFGNSHYKTFDGKIYSFHGMGKYQLVSDCHGRTFSIRIANIQNKRITSTRRVTVKFGDVRINLGQNLKCKVNGESVNLPFKIEGKLKIDKISDTLEVTLNNKITIVWNGKSFLEVTASPFFKNKLCGLCGNFNSNIKDDFKLRKGMVVKDSDVLAFGSSWCVGTKTSCMRQTHQSAKIRACRLRKLDKNPCKHLLSTKVFNGCDSKLNYNRYYKACMLDMCDCPNGGKCYCESLRAYSRECGRLGVNVQTWQRDSFCFAPRNKTRNKKAPYSLAYSKEEITRLLREMNRTRSDRPPIPID